MSVGSAPIDVAVRDGQLRRPTVAPVRARLRPVAGKRPLPSYVWLHDIFDIVAPLLMATPSPTCEQIAASHGGDVDPASVEQVMLKCFVLGWTTTPDAGQTWTVDRGVQLQHGQVEAAWQIQHGKVEFAWYGYNSRPRVLGWGYPLERLQRPLRPPVRNDDDVFDALVELRSGPRPEKVGESSIAARLPDADVIDVEQALLRLLAVGRVCGRNALWVPR